MEITEVENCIRSMPGVENTVVQAIAGRNGKELCAYVVRSGQFGEDEVRRFVGERKPEYMVPAFVMFLDTIPLNVNGKVDRRALPAPDPNSLRRKYSPPRNETEKILCA